METAGTCSPAPRSDGQITVCRRPEYEIRYEDFDGFTLTHMEWHRPLTRAALKRAKSDAATLFELHGAPVHTMAVTPHAGDIAKHQKFVEALGFKFNRPIRCADGVDRGLFTRWE